MISRFHYITQDIPEFSHPELAEFACKGGADWIQLRVKNKQPIPDPSLREGRKIIDRIVTIAEEVKIICKKYNAKLIVNDYVSISKIIKADGVHLGKEDMNPREARKILGNNFIIGGTANTIEDGKWMMENGCDYIGIGPFRFTSTKEKLSPVLGLDGIRNIVQRFSGKIPIIAIGGINTDDIKAILKTGVHGIAVSSAINRSNDITGKTVEFISKISKCSSPELND